MHAVERIRGNGIQVVGILGYEIPALLELLQEIGIEQMGARFLAKYLIGKVDRALFDDGMEETCEESTTKNAVCLFKLYNWQISSRNKDIETCA